MLSPGVLMRMGLNKLLEFMEYEVKDLHELMVTEGLCCLEDLAYYLSEDIDVCLTCGQEFCDVHESPYCTECESTHWINF